MKSSHRKRNQAFSDEVLFLQFCFAKATTQRPLTHSSIPSRQPANYCANGWKEGSVPLCVANPTSFSFISVLSTPGRCSIFRGLGFGKWLICRNVWAQELSAEDELWLETERGRMARERLCSLSELTFQTPTCQRSTFCSRALRVEVIVRNKTCLD